ncbi:MAG: exodeoxyribonuclease V subunit gamma, partial [Acidimicrobiales bacterium]|nr:exodeoxyribonuclease V subunit gamma [Acidimicrobiales bacterium]
MLSVTVADRAEELVDALADALAAPGGDPFAPQWVTVPNLGFRSWLRARLAGRLGARSAGDGTAGDGVVANVEMPLPGTLRWRLLAAHARHAGLPDGPDPWSVDRLVWAVMAVMTDPGATIDDRLRREHLPRGVTMASRAGPIADLFDRYGVHRPDMLRAWAAGDDVDSTGAPLRDEQRWQAGLYRAVAARLAASAGAVPPPADRLAEAVALVRAGTLSVTDGPDPLPDRLYVAGPSILTAELGPVLAALGTQIEVDALLLAPSAVTFRRLADVATAAPAGATSWGLPRAQAGGGAATVAHPLLAGWGRRPLDTATMVGAGGVGVSVVEAPPSSGSTVLARLQADLRGDRPPAPPTDSGLDVPVLDDSGLDDSGLDGSVQVHAAPGPNRQAEVLRDVLLALLRDHPDLTEADIAVVCPQLDRYAPALAAVWGPSAARGEAVREGQVPSLRYSVVDRDARSFNPVLAAMAAVLDVVPGRFEVTAVRDLLHAPAVRERFGLTDDDLDIVAAMIDHASVRWGLDGPQRAPWGIDASHRANSWAAGVDQMMLGIALGEPLIEAAEPVGDGTRLAVGGLTPMTLAEGEIGGAGRVADALRSLAWAHGRLLPSGGRPERTVVEWVAVLREVADRLLAPARYEEWQRARLDAALAELLLAAGVDDDAGAAAVPLTFGDVHRLLAPALDEPRSRADLGFGSVVVARPSLVTGVPFRVVAVLGLDDDALPTRTPSGDDLMVDDERVGDPDRRGDARAALLAAVTSARDHLVVTCTSRDIRTNEEVPRAAMLEELVAVVATTAGVDPA